MLAPISWRYSASASSGSGSERMRSRAPSLKGLRSSTRVSKHVAHQVAERRVLGREGVEARHREDERVARGRRVLRDGPRRRASPPSRRTCTSAAMSCRRFTRKPSHARCSALKRSTSAAASASSVDQQQLRARRHARPPLVEHEARDRWAARRRWRWRGRKRRRGRGLAASRRNRDFARRIACIAELLGWRWRQRTLGARIAPRVPSLPTLSPPATLATNRVRYRRRGSASAMAATIFGMSAAGRSWPMPSNSSSFAPGNDARHLAPRRLGNQRIVGAVDDERGHADLLQLGAPVARGQHGEHLPRGAVGVVAAPGRALAQLAQRLRIGRVAGAADDFHHVHEVIGDAGGIVRVVRTVQDRAERPRPRHRHERIAARGHDGDEARHALAAAAPPAPARSCRPATHRRHAPCRWTARRGGPRRRRPCPPACRARAPRAPSPSAPSPPGIGVCGPSSMRCDSPQSRLSKRTTRKPAFTSPSTNASGQNTSGMPSPITSTIARGAGDRRSAS